ncbi:hypothetical protein TNCV_4587811 [Trichonephila clavipes]|uniref:Uncharacterized protein n=1 Tax=Trichonephila clavipes TaxID=2585209 RepID=A0A8X6S250_TRICX|nr:hypothetical protein TNCV_4587811 [Trichonephila clavipes]
MPAVGCRCHRSACTKTRPDSRVVSRRKKGYENPPSRVRGRMSLSSFRLQQDTNGQHSCATTEKSRVEPRPKKGYENPPSRVRGRMSLSSFRLQQDANVQQSSASTEKGDEHPPPGGCGIMSFSSFRVHQDATGQQSSASTEKGTNTHRHVSAVGCRCHLSACTKMRPDSSRVVPGRKKDEHTPPSDCSRMSVSSFSVHQDATGHQGSARRKKGYQHPPPRGR